MSVIPPHLLQYSSAPPISERGVRLLMADGDRLRLALNVKLLETQGYEVHYLSSLEYLFETIDEHDPDLVILDIALAGTDFDACREIRSHVIENPAPVLLISAQPLADETAAAGLLAGADDCFCTTERSMEFLARVAVQVRNKQYRDALRRIRTERDTLRRDVHLDALTGALSRRTCERMIAAGFNAGKPFAIMYLDIDHFKSFNDDFGHDVGDQVLKAFVATLKRGTRRGDSVGRWGGEEFVMILDVGTPEVALQVAERHREAVSQMHLDHGLSRQVTVSAGLAMFSPEGGETADGLLRRADTALYSAKRCGRNQVVMAEADPPRASEHEAIGDLATNPPQGLPSGRPLRRIA